MTPKVPTTEPIETDSPLLEAAGILLENADGQLFTTHLNKALFYLDAESLLETGKPVTDANYVALKRGPVVENYGLRLVNALAAAQIAMQDDEDPRWKPVILLHRVVPRHMNARQVAMAAKWAKWAKSKTADELSHYSHDNDAWIIAHARGEGSSINLHLAIQQLMDEDPWLKEEATEDEKSALADPDGADFVAW